MLLAVQAVEGATDFKAVVDNPGPTVGERITYTVSFSTDGQLPDIEPPDFDGFDIISGPASSTSIQMVNMAISKTVSLTYTLRPNRPGSVTIKPAKATVKKKLLTSNPVMIEVLAAGGGGGSPSPGSGRGGGGVPSAPPQQGGRSSEVFLTATADKPALSKLEMATITYRLYLRVNVLNYEVVKAPQATGFWVEEFPTANRPILEDVTIKGEPYKVAVIRRIGVFPTRSGQLMLDPLTVDITVERPYQQKRRRDPFDSFFDDPFFSRGQREVKTLTCDPLTLTVRDHPSGAPTDFKGDVGDYTLKVTYDKTQLAQNDALTVKATISGSGYLKSVDAPKLSLPSGFEQFAPTAEANVSVTGSAMRGKKTFTYLVIPRRAGTFNLPPVSFSFFDPDKGDYQTALDGGVELLVSPGEGGAGADLFAGRTPSEVTLMDSDIRFIKSLSGTLARTSIPPYRTVTFFALLALAPALFFGGIGWEKLQEYRQSDPIAVRRRRASSQMRKALEEADKLAAAGDALKAVETAARSLTELVGALIREPSAGMTTDAIRSGLSQIGASDELTAAVIRLFSEADRIRFGGGGDSRPVGTESIARFREAAEALEKLR